MSSRAVEIIAPLVRTGTGFGGACVGEALVVDFAGGAWAAPAYVPLDGARTGPTTRALHYGQSVFEGLKAVRRVGGAVALFRALDHALRLARSCARMSLPAPEPRALVAALEGFVARHAAHAPERPGQLYVRPLVFAMDEDLAPASAARARLQVTLHPVEPFFDARATLRLRTCMESARAYPGGTGAVKCAGNYAAVMATRRDAAAAGFDEVLWLDARERRWVEETSSANVFVVRRGQLITPPTGDTVLAGVTRMTLLEVAPELGCKAEVAPVPIDPRWWRDVDEVFVSGTAAGVVPVSEIEHDGAALFHGEARAPWTTRLAAAYSERLHGTRGG